MNEVNIKIGTKIYLMIYYLILNLHYLIIKYITI